MGALDQVHHKIFKPAQAPGSFKQLTSQTGRRAGYSQPPAMPVLHLLVSPVTGRLDNSGKAKYTRSANERMQFSGRKTKFSYYADVIKVPFADPSLFEFVLSII